MDIWERIKSHLSQKISAEAYQNWLTKTVFLKSEGGKLWVRVPDAVTRDWILQEYAPEIWSSIRELNVPVREILYEVQGSVAIHADQEKTDIVFSPSINLNPKFTFDSFVVGTCNQFAHAAAQAVATNPSRTYNPLFIYGGVGMGKTHLMHAIGRSLSDQYVGMRIIYTSSERFMNEMITCIKNDRMQLFHRHYRSADALLIDDIQILGGKERTQEEFFHTFNDLFEHQKQIVISSDSPPKSTPGLVERLRSRFEWGLMVDVQPPDLETKVAILKRKAEIEKIDLPDDVALFIASKIKSNIRELEGSLVRLMAYASLKALKIDLALAQETLKNIIEEESASVSIEAIQKAVAQQYKLKVADLKSKNNSRSIAMPRQVAMYLCKSMTKSSLPEIGREFGGKHHTTVLHSINKITALIETDSNFHRFINRLTTELQ